MGDGGWVGGEELGEKRGGIGAGSGRGFCGELRVEFLEFGLKERLAAPAGEGVAVDAEVGGDFADAMAGEEEAEGG